MADPISLALGVAPLALSAVKGLKAVRSRFKTLRGHDRVLRRLRRNFTTQSHVFLDECHLLLQQVADPDDVVFMLEDGQSELWSDPGIDKKLKEHLGRKYDDVRETIEDILNLVKSLDERLNRGVERDVRVQLTATEKVREAFDVMSNKADYESDIDHLKELNQEFKRLRTVVKEINTAQTLLARPPKQKRIPKEYRVRGEYARSLYNALRYCWSCTDVRHAEHSMALSLQWEHGCDMQIFLHCAQQGDSAFNINPLALSIQPQDLPPMKAAHTVRSFDSSSGCSDVQPFKRTRFGYNEWSRRPPSPSDHAFQTAIAECTDGPSEQLGKTMDSGKQPTVLVEVNYSESPREPVDLRKSHDVCGALLALADTSNSDPTNKLECFLDTPDSIRHALTVCDPKYRAIPGSNSRRTAMPLLKLLERALDADLGVTQQLRLVLQLVKGHLQLHWTPWWRQYWSLSDLSYFTDSKLGVTDLNDCLDSLHIGTRLDFESLHFDASAFHLEPHVETALLTHGIRNLSLYCLGIALLQIGRWDPLVSATDDVVAIRRLAARNSRLGPRYQNLTQKCIDCDFGEGSDLGNPQLQGTIYESVVCELESLIGLLELV